LFNFTSHLPNKTPLTAALQNRQLNGLMAFCDVWKTMILMPIV